MAIYTAAAAAATSVTSASSYPSLFLSSSSYSSTLKPFSYLTKSRYPFLKLSHPVFTLCPKASSSSSTEPMLPPYNILITGSTKG